MSFTFFVVLMISMLPTLSVSCNGGIWRVNHSPQRCNLNRGEYTLTCNKNNWPSECGTRLDGRPRLGKGTYSASIKATRASGTVTTFYLYQYGRNNKQDRPWNEVDIEILGKQIGSRSSKIWTNLFTGKGVQHVVEVTVPWDASAGFHDYKIKIDDTTVYWIFDGVVRRTYRYTGHSDFVSTVNRNDFQAEISLWGGSGGFTGSLKRNTRFPLRAYYKNIVIAKRLQTVALKSVHNTYVRIESNNNMDVKANRIGSWERIIEYKDQSNRGISYFESSVWGKLITAENGGNNYVVKARGTINRGWERWRVIYLGSGRFALKSAHNRYLRASPNGELDAQATRIGAWEKFQIVRLGAEIPPVTNTNWYMFTVNEKYKYLLFVVCLLVILNVFCIIWNVFKYYKNGKKIVNESDFEDEENKLLQSI